LLDLCGNVYACLFGFEGRWGRPIFELVRLNLYGDLRRRLGVRIFKEKMQIRLDFRVGSWLYIIRRHFFLILTKVGKLVGHIFLF